MMASTKRPLAAQLIVWLHFAFVAFFVFGWLLPRVVLPWHVFSIPLVILHWKLNKDQCILTQWQLHLEGRSQNQENEGEFIKSLFRKMGMELSRKQLFLVIYGLLLLSGTLSAIRLFLSS